MIADAKQLTIIRDAHERVSNLEPFTSDELAELEAIPGVTVEGRRYVRRGIVLDKLTWMMPMTAAPVGEAAE